LLELDGIKVSVEMVRRIQIDLGLWRPKTRKARRVFQLRQRRPRFGELIQIDGSPHDWFEGRGPRCTLIVFIDDATGWPTALRFAPVESGTAYLAALREPVQTHGRPLAFYSDRHSVFRVNAKDAACGDGKTEFGRVVERLDIGLINALTPQAKGRVERANQTLQDRLIKEMRLRNISSMQAAQAFLPIIYPHVERQVRDPAERSGAGAPAMDADRGRVAPCCWRGARSAFCQGTDVQLWRHEILRQHRRRWVVSQWRHHPALASRCAAVLVHKKTLDARLDAIVAAHKPAAAIVSGVVATSSPAPAAPRCAALGLDPATMPGSPLQMPLMTCLVRMP
jgi:hypothetical protein